MGDAVTKNTPIELGNETDGIYHDIYDISTGATHTLVLREDGKVYSAGLNTNAPLGTGNTTARSTLAPALTKDEEGNVIDLENIASISSGNTTSFAVSKNGEVYSAGLNTSGQLGLNHNTSPVNTFTKVLDDSGEQNLQNVIIVANGAGNTINSSYITKDGTIYTCGDNANGQLANDTYYASYLPIVAGNASLKTDKMHIKLEVNSKEQIALDLEQGFNVYNNTKQLDAGITYEVLNKDIAEVSNSGLVTGKRLGTTRVKITDKANKLEKYVQVIVLNSYGYTQSKISSGLNFTVALKEDGTVWAWGAGASGRLGNGSTANQTEEVQVLAPDGKGPLKNVKDIAVGYDSASALLEDGTVVSWGNNGSTNLGNGTSTDSSIPVYVLDTNGEKIQNIVQISRGNDVALALTKDGEVYSWGYNGYGQLGIGSTTNSSYAVKVKEPTGKGTIKGIIEVFSGMYHSTLLAEDGTVWAMGLNDAGQIGDGTTSQRNLPVQSKITQVDKLVISSHSQMAIKEDGSFWTWGWNAYGQLSDGTTTNRPNPIQPKWDSATIVTDIIDMGSAGATHYILDSSHRVYAAGLNSTGQVGDNTTTNKSYFVEVKGKYGETLPNNIVKISQSVIRPNSSTDTSVGYFTREDGSILGAGKNTSYQLFGKNTDVLKTAKEMKNSYTEITPRVIRQIVGQTQKLNINIVENFNIYAKKPVLGTITWSSSNEQIATVDENGNVTGNAEGQTTIIAKDSKYGYIAMATVYITRNTQNAITLPQVTQGQKFTVVLKADGTVWAVGQNNYGQCGTKSNEANLCNLQPVKTAEGKELTDIVKIVSGVDHTLALTKDGKVYSWGYNNYGQLGINSKVNQNVANFMLDENGEAPIENVIDIAAGNTYSTILKENGEVYAVGENSYGQIGDNTLVSKMVLTQIEEIQNVVQIANGGWHTVMLRGDGTVWTVGRNRYGELGINATNDTSTASAQGKPIVRQTINHEKNGVLRNITQIAAGGYHTIALTTAKQVYTWGYGLDGQLGNGAKSNYNYPQIVLDNTDGENGIGNIKKIGSAERVTFLITDNNEVYATGENSNYQLSQNHNTDLSTVEKLYSQNGEDYITDIIGVTSSCKNINNTALIKADGTVWVAGLGANGQIGNGAYQTAYLYTRMGSSKLDAGEKIVTIAQGETHQLKVSVKSGFNVYEDTQEQAGKVTYTSGTPAIATVNAEGVITAVTQGEARIFIYDETNLWSTSVAVKVTRDQTDTVKAEIAAGTASVILKTDGSVWSIGRNDYGQRGIGNTDKYVEETAVLDTNGKDKLTNVISVSAGSYFATAVKEDGRVVAWGQNTYGQLGNKTNANSSLPTYVIDSNGNELTGVIKVVSGSSYTLALKADGTVWAWGYNNYGQLGNNTGTNSNVAVQVKDPTGLGTLKNICDISVQAHTSHALTDEGEVYGWGYNYHGQIGDGTRQTGGNPTGRRKLLPVKLSINNVVKLVGGYHHTLALKADGTVWAWGLNRYGTLGYGSSSTDGNSTHYCKASPMQVKINSTTFLTNVIDIGTAYETTFAVTEDKNIYGWGYNNSGQIGNNSTSNYNLAQPLKKLYGEAFTDKIVALSKSTSVSTNYMIREDGIVLGNGYTGSEQRLMTNRTGNITTVKELRPDYMQVDQRANYVKQGDNITLQVSVAKRLNAFAQHIKLGNLSFSSSNTEIATVTNDGTVTAVGLGEATITVKDIEHGYQAQAIIYVIQNHEQVITMPDISQGTDFTTILKADGSVWTTGLNNNGQCGDGTVINRSKPVRVKTSSKEYLSGIVKIASGTDHVLALTKEGEVYAWGLNDVGQLGNGTTTRSVYAAKVLNSNAEGAINNVIDISSGHKFSIMLLKDGTVWGIGRNVYGELGTLNYSNKVLPAQMDEIANAVRVQANSSSSSVQIGNGTVWTTGYNQHGTLGQNAVNTGSSAASQGRNAANPVVNNTRNGILTNVVKLVGGLHQTVVLQEDNTVYTWGYNHAGQLGVGNTTTYSYPVKPKLAATGLEITDKVVNIGASGYRTILQIVDEQKEKHTLITGYNNYGQLGNNTTTNATSFIPVNDKNNEEEAKELDILPDDSRATNHTGYIDENGTVWTVGLNNYGQLGDDTVYQRKNIVQIGETELKVKEIIFTMNPEDTKQIESYIQDSFNVYVKENKVGTLKYESLDNSIAQVNETGLVTAKGIGDTLIRVIDLDKNIQSAVYVKVIKKQEDMKYEPMVDGGANHSVALKGDGTVWAWGYNKYGQLGNNTTVTTEIPVQVKGKNGEGFLSDIQMIASGSNHVLALKQDGTVWAWGYNNYGQLGDNTQITKYTPVQVLSEDATEELKDIIYIAAGTNFSVAVNKQGEVWTWGQNDYGQLGDGSKTAKYTPVRVKANLSGIIKVACGYRHTVALKSDGSVYTWGDNTNGQLGDNTNVQRLIPVKMLETADSNISDALSISATNYTTNILKANGTVLSVGLGTSGQLGDGTKTTKKLPVAVKDLDGLNNLSNIKNIKSGANTTYALTKNGTIYSWGIGTNGQLGNDTIVNTTLPVEVANNTADGIIDNILYIGAGANHGLAVENTGYVEVWGLNDQKQVGDSTLAKSAHPLYIGSKIIADPSDVTLEIGDTKQIQVSMQSFNLFRPEENLNRNVTYKSLNADVATISPEGLITAKGMGITTGVITDNLSSKVTTVQISVLENGAVATPKVVSGLNHTIALKADGTVWTWGYNHHGQLGNGTVQSSYIPEKINLKDVIDIAAGDHFSMALKKDGTVWVWGYNDRGQLAQGNKVESLVPIQIKGVNGGSLPKVTKIAACRFQWIALLETSEVIACGANTQSLLGDGTSTDKLYPVYMLEYNGTAPVTAVKDISIGQCESFIVKEDGTLWSVGHNCQGGMGVGNTTAYTRIKQVQDTTGTGVLSNIIQISAGGWYNLALDANGNVWAMGRNTEGELGINSTTAKNRPQKVLGVGGTGYLEDIVRIEAGYYSSYAIDKNGNVYGWGYNNRGQLGINNTTTRKVPTQVLAGPTGGTLDNVMLVSSNGYHTTFVKYDGTVWTTGYNGNGELGNDSTVSRTTVECISNPKLEVDQKYLLFTDKLGETKKLNVKVNSGFNLLTDTAAAGVNTFKSLNTNVVEVDQTGNVISTGSGTTYIKITNETTGLTATVKVVVPHRDGITIPKIVGGANHYVALKADGTVWTWGYNGYGQLGIGNTTNQLEPVKTTMSDVIDIAAGTNYTAVLKKDGTVWVTGQNNYGQLGQNNTNNTNNFVQVKSENGLGNLEGIVAITAVNYHMAALKNDGTVVAWGYNAYGQLGNNTTTTAKLPTRVRRVSSIMDIAAGRKLLNSIRLRWKRMGYRT